MLCLTCSAILRVSTGRWGTERAALNIDDCHTGHLAGFARRPPFRWYAFTVCLGNTAR